MAALAAQVSGQAQQHPVNPEKGSLADHRNNDEEKAETKAGQV